MTEQVTGADTKPKVNKEALLKGWNPFAQSINNELLPHLESLTAKSRDLYAGNGIGTSIVNTITDKVIGTELKIIPQIDYKVLGLSADEAKEWNDITEQYWNLFANSKNIDVEGRNTFQGLCRLVINARVFNGEILALPYWNNNSIGLFNTQIQLVECDRLLTPDNLENDETIKAGIKLDNFNKPVKYYISKQYPNDDYSSTNLEFNEIPAETKFGRKRVIHAFEQERVGQLRGKPLFTPVLTQFKKLDMYEEAELSAAVVSAMIALIIEMPEKSDEELMKAFGLDTPEEVNDIRMNWDRAMKNGNILQLFSGEKATSFSPNRPNSAFSAFVEHIVRNICVATGLPAEMVMKDFSKCNYSSARAALQEGWERIMSFRAWLVDNFVKEIYCLFIEEIANKGLIKAPDFYKYKEAYLKIAVHGPTRGVLDPVKEANAAKIRMENGISSRQDECAALGKNFDDVINQISKERAKEKELGLIFITDSNLNKEINAEPTKEDNEDE